VVVAWLGFRYYSRERKARRNQNLRLAELGCFEASGGGPSVPVKPVLQGSLPALPAPAPAPAPGAGQEFVQLAVAPGVAHYVRENAALLEEELVRQARCAVKRRAQRDIARKRERDRDRNRRGRVNGLQQTASEDE